MFQDQHGNLNAEYWARFILFQNVNAEVLHTTGLQAACCIRMTHGHKMHALLTVLHLHTPRGSMLSDLVRGGTRLDAMEKISMTQAVCSRRNG